MKSGLCLGAAITLAVCASTSGRAQTAPVLVGAPPSSTVLARGTEISLRTKSELSSKDSRVGERFNLEVIEDVRLGSQIVIPSGSLAVGEVTQVSGKGMFGKSGKIQTRLLYVRIGDQDVRISGAVGDRGKGGTAATVGTLLFVWPAAFFVTGTSAVLPPGTGAVGALESDLPIVFATSTPLPAPAKIVVVSAAPVTPVPAQISAVNSAQSK